MHSSSTQQNMRLKAVLTNSQGQTTCAYLPESASLLGSVLNDSNTLLSLMQNFGGCTLRIPKKWPPKPSTKESTKPKRPHALCQVLSAEQMAKVVAYFGGTEVYIPKGARYLGQVRNHEIIESYSKATGQGVSSGHVVQKLAQRYGLSDRRIWDILKTTPPQDAHEGRIFGDICMSEIDSHSHIQ